MQTNNNGLTDQERGERIAQRAFDLVEAFLDGRAAIVISRNDTGKAHPDTGDALIETQVRLRMDRAI